MLHSYHILIIYITKNMVKQECTGSCDTNLGFLSIIYRKIDVAVTHTCH